MRYKIGFNQAAIVCNDLDDSIIHHSELTPSSCHEEVGIWIAFWPHPQPLSRGEGSAPLLLQVFSPQSPVPSPHSSLPTNQLDILLLIDNLHPQLFRFLAFLGAHVVAGEEVACFLRNGAGYLAAVALHTCFDTVA